ncbi:MAG: 30S ribosomal protein S8 [Deltaproteobacteria bacterium]|nr:30S ribosomal protein S8 [Deltaproteobacteria bacterium]MBI4223303.1 30S ribosomal protein S8 [Deltaproteobacteria bacterium]
MMTDPLSDLLTRIRNALMMRHEQVTIPHSKLKESVGKILSAEGYISGLEVVGKGTQKALVLQLKYLPDGAGAITNLSRVSRLSRRVYLSYKDLKPFRGGLGTQILSTSKGILTDGEARKQKVGGEILLELW